MVYCGLCDFERMGGHIPLHIVEGGVSCVLF